MAHGCSVDTAVGSLHLHRIGAEDVRLRKPLAFQVQYSPKIMHAQELLCGCTIKAQELVCSRMFEPQELLCGSLQRHFERTRYAQVKTQSEEKGTVQSHLKI